MGYRAAPFFETRARLCKSEIALLMRAPQNEGGSNSAQDSEIRLRGFRDREQVVAEVIVIVLGADEFLPLALLLAPARHHVHGLVEGVLVLDLDEDFEESPVRGQLEALSDTELF